ncbi:MAG: phosphoenolpyruvate--protein phosphotransferase, partial [Alphaproteobacteria bacterium]|nr:phosphoenolpyruvate--protein phosphotransferase [Alphaproteobacteria bacterium]
FGEVPKGAIIVAEELTPADTAAMDTRRVAGFATAQGGAEGHTAIMARSLALPAVLGVAGLPGLVEAGDIVIVDGLSGRVVINPAPAALRRYRERQKEFRAKERRLARLRDVRAETRDGVTISLQANLELPEEVAAAHRAGAEGIGLLRSEFIFMNRESPPDEEEQFQAMAAIVESMKGSPVTIRTLDVGGEKLAYSLGPQLAEAVNPALGLRAIRLSLKLQPLLETQLAAILRAGGLGPVRILLPMVTSPSEVRQVREILKRVARRLKRRGVAIAEPLPPVGVMIETPAAALAADALAYTSDFFSIGTNDLTMYTLAIDRADESVAHLYNPLHPAVLRLILATTEAALKARIPINLCGEMAGDPRCTVLLLGMGLRDLSMSSTSLPRVKQRIRKLTLDAARQRARTIMEQSDAGRIAAILDDFNALA